MTSPALPLGHLRRPLGADRPYPASLAAGPDRPASPGEPTRTDPREVLNALLYLNRTGTAWKYLPHDLPPHGTVYYHYARRDEGLFVQFNIEPTALARVKEGRASEPTAAIIDTQSDKTSTNPPLETQGTDAVELIVGRKSSIATDALGLLLVVIVCAAPAYENNAGMRILNQA